MGLLDRIFASKDFGSSDPAAASIFRGNYADPPRRGTPQLLNAYNELPRFRGMMNKIANSVASTRWRAFKQPGGKFGQRAVVEEFRSAGWKDRRELLKGFTGREGIEEVIEHPLIDLIQRPTPYLTARQSRIVGQICVDIAGEIFFLIERDMQSGQPFELWPIPPHWVSRTPTIEDPHFEMHGVFDATTHQQMKPHKNDVLWFKDPDPYSPYGRGTGFGHALSDDLDIEEYTVKTAGARYYNQAAPNLLIGIEGADKSALLREQKKWEDQYRGWKRAFRTHFASTGKITVHKIDQSFADLQMAELREMEGKIIYQSTGMPPEVMGMIMDSNRSTIDAADFLYAVGLLVPRLDFWEDQVNSRLAPMFDDDVVLLYESPVPEDWEFIQKHMKDHPYAFKLDELRDVIDFPALPENGDLHPIKAGWSFGYPKEGVVFEPENNSGPGSENENEEGARDDEM